MSKPTLTDTLLHMTQAQNGRSETSRLRDVFPDIERALAAGVRRQAILDALHQDGFTMNMKAFEKALYRIRIKAKQGLPQVVAPALARPVAATVSSPEVVPHTEQPVAKKKSHAFAGLGGNGRDADAVHYSVPDHDRIYDRKKTAAE